MKAKEVNKNYKRKSFNTMIDEETQNNFSQRCKDEGMKMNIVIEYFMKEYLDGNLVITMIDKRKLQKDVYLRERTERINGILEELRTHSDYEKEEFEKIREEIEGILNG